MEDIFICHKCGKENKYNSLRFEEETQKSLILEMKISKEKEIIINCNKCGTPNKVKIKVM
ncbi:MAG: hypothetical protein ACE5KZ_00055 [Candidatus Scalinduaceae bacterium]